MPSRVWEAGGTGADPSFALLPATHAGHHVAVQLSRILNVFSVEEEGWVGASWTGARRAGVPFSTGPSSAHLVPCLGLPFSPAGRRILSFCCDPLSPLACKVGGQHLKPRITHF